MKNALTTLVLMFGFLAYGLVCVAVMGPALAGPPDIVQNEWESHGECCWPPGERVNLNLYVGVGTAPLPGSSSLAVYIPPNGKDLLIESIQLDNGRPSAGGTDDPYALRLDHQPDLGLVPNNRAWIIVEAPQLGSGQRILAPTNGIFCPKGLYLSNLTAFGLQDIRLHVTGRLIDE